MDYYIGWDVGGWNCDRNRNSQDALCALRGDWDNLELAGEPWQGNLRQVLAEDGVLPAILRRVRIEPREGQSITWAIDTPLGWPNAFRELICANGYADDVPEQAAQNPYLFRQTEQWVGRQGFRCPLSAVRDMIGSQSTKGIHLLRRCGFARQDQDVGIWRVNGHTVIETYPAPVRTSPRLRARFQGLHNPLWHQDVKDSLWCALVAALFALDRNCLCAPDQNVPPEEGWIWVPTDFNARQR